MSIITLKIGSIPSEPCYTRPRDNTNEIPVTNTHPAKDISRYLKLQKSLSSFIAKKRISWENMMFTGQRRLQKTGDKRQGGIAPASLLYGVYF